MYIQPTDINADDQRENICQVWKDILGGCKNCQEDAILAI